MNTRRFTNGIYRRILGLIRHIRVSLKYFLGSSEFSNKDSFIVNILIVKNPAYIKIAKICINSFLHFHPNAKVKIHCDEKTFFKAKSTFRSKKLEVLRDCINEDPWQLSKLKLFLKLSGTREILMDADLKWNGPLPELSSVTYFVREFTFKDNKVYVELFEKLGWQQYINYSMKNTSFVTLNEVRFSEDKIHQQNSMIKLFEKQVNESELKDREKKDLIRISEQVILSLEFDDINCKFLKVSDRQFDGSLVESSYFGATGTRFGIFGTTSR